MKIGYPCINLSLDCSSSRTFRLASFGRERFLTTVDKNLDCLERILEFNLKNKIFFFRLTSGLIPFASHSLNRINWQKIYQMRFKKIGEYIKKNKMRVAMHPGQFTVINSPSKKVRENSIRELVYHAQILELLGMNGGHKMQIHLGGGYGDKNKAMENFIITYKKLPALVKKYLVIENDDHIFSVGDCLRVSKEIGIPIVFDVFHHSILNNGESIKDLLKRVSQTWKKKDGSMMIDFSTQKPKARIGSHAQLIDLKKFREFLGIAKIFNPDIMLEIKDKEKSVLAVNNFTTK